MRVRILPQLSQRHFDVTILFVHLQHPVTQFNSTQVVLSQRISRHKTTDQKDCNEVPVANRPQPDHQTMQFPLMHKYSVQRLAASVQSVKKLDAVYRRIYAISMHIYFSGIGGAAIGPLALIAKQADYTVSGSDKQA